MITDSQITTAMALLAQKRHIVIFTHISPDGDAMGSSLGLKRWLEEHRTEVGLAPDATVSIIVPNSLAAYFGWMPGVKDVIIHSAEAGLAAELCRNADLMFCLDFNEPKRIGDVAPLLTENTCQKIMIDHHLHPSEELVDLCISHPEAPATAYLVLQFINGLCAQLSTVNCQLSTDVATCLYTGLMTDTGNFAFNSNNPVLYEMIAQLIRAGINKDRIYDAIFNQFSVSRLEMTGYCLFRKMQIFKKYHTALITLSASELKRFNFQSGDAEGIVNLPLQIGEIKYSVFMREDVDKIKISFRSQGDRPVNILAHELFNGGGHMNAAGGESYNTLDKTIQIFTDNYQKYFTKD